MPRFSIIVPYLGDTIQFEQTLASVLRNQSFGTDVIVPHNGSYENVHELGSEVTFVETEPSAKLVRLFNCGLRSSQNEYVALVRPGAELSEGWEPEILAAFQSDDHVASVAPALIASATDKRLVAAGVQHGFGMNRKLVGTDVRMAPRKLRKIEPLGPTSWAAFYRRSALEQFGTPDESLASVYLDLDIALGLKSLGQHCRFVPNCVVQIGQPNLLVKEAQEAHGVAAQRAVRRHPLLAAKSSFLGTAVSELARSPFQSNLFRHLFQRFQAAQFKDINDSFAKRIRERKSTAVPSVSPTQSTIRRAA